MKFIIPLTVSDISKLLLKPKNDFKQIYDESGITILYHDYVKKMSLTLIAVIVLSFITTLYVHISLYNLVLPRAVIAALSLTIVSSCTVGLILLFYPVYMRNKSRSEIDSTLVYTLSYMTILSASGMAIENIMEQILKTEDNPSIKQLSTKFIMDTKLFGYEVPAALDDIARRSASKRAKNIFSSIKNDIQTSGDLTNLLTFEVESQMQIQKEGLKKFLNVLTYMGELYVAMIVIAPILFIVMITILSVLGGGSSSNSAIVQLLLIVFLGTPILGTGFMIILDTMLGGDQ